MLTPPWPTQRTTKSFPARPEQASTKNLPARLEQASTKLPPLILASLTHGLAIIVGLGLSLKAGLLGLPITLFLGLICLSVLSGRPRRWVLVILPQNRSKIGLPLSCKSFCALARDLGISRFESRRIWPAQASHLRCRCFHPKAHTALQGRLIRRAKGLHIPLRDLWGHLLLVFRGTLDEQTEPCRIEYPRLDSLAKSRHFTLIRPSAKVLLENPFYGIIWSHIVSFTAPIPATDIASNLGAILTQKMVHSPHHSIVLDA